MVRFITLEHSLSVSLSLAAECARHMQVFHVDALKEKQTLVFPLDSDEKWDEWRRWWCCMIVFVY